MICSRQIEASSCWSKFPQLSEMLSVPDQISWSKCREHALDHVEAEQNMGFRASSSPQVHLVHEK